MAEHALFAGVAKSLTEHEMSQGNLPTATATLRGVVVGTEKLWGQPPLALRVASKKQVG